MRKIIILMALVVFASYQVPAQFYATSRISPLPVSSGTADKPQSKVWTYDGRQWAVLANSVGTHIWRLDDSVWTNVLRLSTSTTAKADCKVVGNTVHVFLYKGINSQFASAEYDPLTKTYKPWSVRSSLVPVSLDQGVETATIDVDGTGRMWLASAGDTTINVRYSDYPYASWSAPVTLASNVLDDDICDVIYNPALAQVGVLWSNQRTKRFGFRTHADGADPTLWTTDEVPASQSALNVGFGFADDHLNMSVAANGTLYCAVKTSYDTKGYVHLGLLVRRPTGAWDNLYPVSTIGTRPIVILNEAKAKLWIIYSDNESGGNIVYKESGMSAISFSPQYTLITGVYNNPTSSKDNYTSATVVLASNSTQAIGAYASDDPVLLPPVPPTLLSPTDIATAVPVSPTLSWNAAATATNYQVQVASDFAFTNLISDQTGLTATSAQVSGLANNTVYYWRVKAQNAAGSSNWSSVWSFTTETLPLLPPSAPVLVSPSDLAQNIPVAPILTWNTAATSDNYALQVSGTPDFAATVINQTGLTTNSAAISGLGGNVTYYWRVKAGNAGGSSSWSAVWSFTTELLPPNAPVLIAPADLASGLSLNPVLSWNAPANAESYQVQVAAASDFATLLFNESNLLTTTFQAQNLTNNTTYFWRVKAENSAGSSAWSQVRSFTTLLLPPAAPVLTSPADLAIDIPLSPTLTWNAAAGATSYSLQVSANQNFNSLAVNQSNLVSLTFQPQNLTDNTTYYWRVAAVNAAGNSWSQVWSFKTLLLPPAAPTQASPANQALNISLSPTLSWNATTNAAKYEAQVATDIAFTSLIADQTELTDDFAVVSGLAGSTTYFWRVRAANIAGNSAWSGTRSFTTLLLPPDAPTLVLPVNQATAVAVPVGLSWNGSASTVSYDLEVSGAADFSVLAFSRTNLTTTSISVNGLFPNTQYYWRIRANNAAGSTWSVVQSFVTDPNAPSGPLVGHWQMEEPSGNILLDASAFGNNAETVGNPVKVSGAYGLALKLNGINQYATLPDNPSLHLNNAITIAAWIRPRAKANMIIMKKGSATANGYELSLASTGQAYFRFNNATAGDLFRLNSTVSYPTNGSTWMHVAATFDGTILKIYINGSENASKTLTGPVSIDSNLLALAIGAQDDGTSKLNADLDDVRLYNTSLTPAQVRDLVTGGPVAVVPLAPTLVSPADLALGQNVPLSLTWNSASGAASYQMQLSASPLFSTNLYDLSGITNTSAQVTGLAPNATYFWRIRATNQSGNSLWSAPWSFTTTASLPTGPLVGHWRMDEPSGTTLLDASAFGNNAATVGNPTKVTGVNGLALNLNGSSQYAAVTSNASLNLTNSITLAAWIRPKSRKKHEYILQKAAVGLTDGYELSIEKDGKVCFRFNQASSGDTYKLSSLTAYPTNGTTWMHVAATFNGSVMRIYINGTLNNSKTLTFPRSINVNNLALGIGAQYDGNSKFNGAIDEARIYNSVLTATEISSLATFSAARLAAPATSPAVVSQASIFSNQEDLIAYPNPFSARTTLHFTLHEEGEYILTLYNNKGKQVKILKQGHAAQGTIHDIELDAADLPRGLYFVRLQTPEKVHSLRLILEK